MAVQARYPSNVVFHSRGEQERKDMDFTPVTSAFIDQSTMLFNNGGNVNSRKRVREAMAAVAPMAMSLTPQLSAPTSATAMTVAQLQSHQHPLPLISTGLRLAFEDHQHRNQSHSHSNSQSNLLSSTSNNCSVFPSLISDDLVNQINQQKDEIEHFLVAQGEQLRRALAEKRQRHLRSLLVTAEESAARRLKDKEAEAERLARRRAELEERLTRLRTESMAWQMKAMADQATAASLHAQIQAAAPPIKGKCAGAGVGDECGESNRAEDAESAYIDPDRVETNRACRTCHCRPASVVLLPCRHLCLCDDCDSATSAVGSVQCCPVCRSVRTGSVLVFLC